MESFWLDLRYGLRMLIRSPSFTIVAVGVIALGIAAGTAIFSVVNAVLLRPLPYTEPERLLLVQESLPKLSLRTSSVSAAEYWDYKEGNEVFSNIASFTTTNLNLTGQGEAARISHEAQTDPLALLRYLDRFVDVSEATAAEMQVAKTTPSAGIPA